MPVLMRNRFNHFILNKLLALRYLTRMHPYMIKLIALIEILLIKIGIISYGQKRL